jgi:hypothetical protein
VETTQEIVSEPPKNRPRVFRILRILWTVFCGIACVLMIVLWVRSNYRVEQIFVPITRSTYFSAGSMPNAFGFEISNKSPTDTWAWLSMTAHGWLAIRDPTAPRWSGSGFFRISTASVVMPYWVGALSLDAIATLPWIRWRFSLRTLLIATTLVAVVIGLIVAVLRWPAG